MAIKFKTKLLFSRTGVFDSIGIGVQDPSGGVHISGRDLRLTSGNAYFDSRPFVDGYPVMLSGDTVSVDVSDLYPANNPSGFINQLPSDLLYSSGNQAINGSLEVSGVLSVSGSKVVTSHPSDANPVYYIRVLDQSEYDAIASPDFNTLYFIKP